MSLLVHIPRSTFRGSSLLYARGYASASNSKARSSASPQTASPESNTKNALSSCPAGAVMNGLNYLKGEPPVLAQPDEAYPTWLWDLAKPKVLTDDGPGGKAEKRQLRLAHRQRLKDSNLFKAK